MPHSFLSLSCFMLGLSPSYKAHPSLLSSSALSLVAVVTGGRDSCSSWSFSPISYNSTRTLWSIPPNPFRLIMLLVSYGKCFFSSSSFLSGAAPFSPCRCYRAVSSTRRTFVCAQAAVPLLTLHRPLTLHVKAQRCLAEKACVHDTCN